MPRHPSLSSLSALIRGLHAAITYTPLRGAGLMSADTTGQSFPRHPWDVVIAVVAGVALIVVLSLAALVIVPPAVANLGSEASDGSTAASIGDSGATVVVPTGWVEAGAGTDVVTVRTPDGVLTVRLSPSAAGLDATLDKTLDELATAVALPPPLLVSASLVYPSPSLTFSLSLPLSLSCSCSFP